MTEKKFDGNTAQRVEDYGDGSHALVVKVVGGSASSTSSTPSSGGGSYSNSGVIAGVDTAGTQWLMIVNASTTPPTITYTKVSDGASGTPVGGFIPDADQAEWEDASYVLNSSGQLTSETQKRGTATRTRTWTYATDASGNVTATPGEWA